MLIEGAGWRTGSTSAATWCDSCGVGEGRRVENKQNNTKVVDIVTKQSDIKEEKEVKCKEKYTHWNKTQLQMGFNRFWPEQ